MKYLLILVGFVAVFGVGHGQPCDQYQRLQCPNGRCIPSYYVCDGYNDCGDWSDEQQDCPACPKYSFQCLNGKCVSECLLCDKFNDCGDWSDEHENCPGCPDGYFNLFECPNGKCIPQDWICDGDNDCGDWGDESASTCPCWGDQIRCQPPKGENGPAGECIWPEDICDPDGRWDCEDGYDEINCTTTARSVAQINQVKSFKIEKGTYKHASQKKALKTRTGKSKAKNSKTNFLEDVATDMKKQKRY